MCRFQFCNAFYDYLSFCEFDPTNQIPYTLALAFQLIPTDLRGLPIRIGAIVGACIVTFILLLFLPDWRRKNSNKNIQSINHYKDKEMVYQLGCSNSERF